MQTKKTLPFKAIIFDMDGTLLQSTEADYKAWERVFKQYGKTLRYEDYLPMLGIRSADVISNFLGFPHPDDVARILMEKFEHFADYVRDHPVEPVPGAPAFLHSLQQYDLRVGLATSSRPEKTNLLLNQLGLYDYFEVVVTGNMVTNSKPAPDIFLKAAGMLDIAPADCLVIEDGPIGVAAAKRAGMRCVAITATHPAEKLAQADALIDAYETFDLESL